MVDLKKLTLLWVYGHFIIQEVTGYQRFLKYSCSSEILFQAVSEASLDTSPLKNVEEINEKVWMDLGNTGWVTCKLLFLDLIKGGFSVVKIVYLSNGLLIALNFLFF